MKQSKTFIIRISLIVALGGFLMGFDASVISGVVKFIEPHFNLTKLQIGWAVSCLTLTATLAMIVSGPLSDRFGRRPLLMVAALLYAISAIASALAPTFLFLIIARMVGGIGVGASLILAPMYIAEIAPSKIRGTMVSFNQLNIVIGISVAFFTNYLILRLGNDPAPWVKQLGIDSNNWRWMLGLEAIPAILYFIFLWTVPESPRWLAMNGNREKAFHILSKVESEEEAEKNLQALEASMNNVEVKKKVPIAELFKPALRLVLVLGVVVAIAQQITGINAVFFYAPMIFEQTGIGTDASFSQAILVGLTNLVFTVLAMYLIDKVGRKALLMFGLSGIVICMGLLSYGFSNASYTLESEDIEILSQDIKAEKLNELAEQTYNSDLEFKAAVIDVVGEELWAKHETAFVNQAILINPWFILIGIIGFVASFAVSLGPVMWVLFSELFPNWIRGLAISFAGFINSGVSFIVQLVFPWELANIGNSGTFLIYGVFGVVALIVLAIYLPETKGRTLEDLEKILVKEK